MSQAAAVTGPEPGDLVTSTRARLARSCQDRSGVGPAGDIRADLVLDAGDAGACTIVLWDGRVSAHPGRTERPVTRIRGDLSTLHAIVDARRSGIDAFLAGQLRVTGDLSLALLLDGLFEIPDHGPGRSLRRSVREAGGVRTAYLEAGRPDARPVVLLHGLGATNASMLPTLWDLAPDHLVIAPDLPGHGASTAPAGPYDAAFFGRWLTAFLDDLGLDDVVLAGHSLGGRISLEIALSHPERVQALVLLTPAVAFRRLRQMVPVVRILRPEMAVVPLRITQAAVAAGMRTMFAHPERVNPTVYEAAAGEFVRVYRDRSHLFAFYACLRQIYLDDAFGAGGFWRRLPDLRPPALFVWGRKDRLVPSAFARHVTRAVPAATTVVLDDCGHVPHFERPDTTNRVVRDFLDAGPGRPR